MIAGGCHCGAIRYELEGDAITHALCHCTDCRRAHGRLDNVSASRGQADEGDAKNLHVVRTRPATFLPGLRHRPFLYQRRDIARPHRHPERNL